MGPQSHERDPSRVDSTTTRFSQPEINAWSGQWDQRPPIYADELLQLGSFHFGSNDGLIEQNSRAAPKQPVYDDFPSGIPAQRQVRGPIYDALHVPSWSDQGSATHGPVITNDTHMQTRGAANTIHTQQLIPDFTLVTQGQSSGSSWFSQQMPAVQEQCHPSTSQQDPAVYHYSAHQADRGCVESLPQPLANRGILAREAHFPFDRPHADEGQLDRSSIHSPYGPKAFPRDSGTAAVAWDHPTFSARTDGHVPSDHYHMDLAHIPTMSSAVEACSGANSSRGARMKSESSRTANESSAPLQIPTAKRQAPSSSLDDIYVVQENGRPFRANEAPAPTEVETSSAVNVKWAEPLLPEDRKVLLSKRVSYLKDGSGKRKRDDELTVGPLKVARSCVDSSSDAITSDSPNSLCTMTLSPGSSRDTTPSPWSSCTPTLDPLMDSRLQVHESRKPQQNNAGPDHVFRGKMKMWENQRVKIKAGEDPVKLYVKAHKYYQAKERKKSAESSPSRAPSSATAVSSMSVKPRRGRPPKQPMTLEPVEPARNHESSHSVRLSGASNSTVKVSDSREKAADLDKSKGKMLSYPLSPDGGRVTVENQEEDLTSSVPAPPFPSPTRSSALQEDAFCAPGTVFAPGPNHTVENNMGKKSTPVLLLKESGGHFNFQASSSTVNVSCSDTFTMTPSATPSSSQQEPIDEIFSSILGYTDQDGAHLPIFD